jgi:endonuclease/exonuclease/phosphatase family metal-dependent hydrolase
LKLFLEKKLTLHLANEYFKMKIGTLNIDWFKKSKATQNLIKEKINEQDFDFLIVTENIRSFNFSEKYFAYHSQPIPTDKEFQHLHYGNYLKGETPIRTSVYSKHKSIETIEVLDAYTSVCHKFWAEEKEIVIYGSIIGTWGIKYQNEIARIELENFKSDVENIMTQHENVVIAGDFNTSFFEKEKRELAAIKSRKELIAVTDKFEINRATENLGETIDYIFISSNLFNQSEIIVSTFLENNSLKDEPHKGVCVEII